MARCLERPILAAEVRQVGAFDLDLPQLLSGLQLDLSEWFDATAYDMFRVEELEAETTIK